MFREEEATSNSKCGVGSYIASEVRRISDGEGAVVGWWTADG